MQSYRYRGLTASGTEVEGIVEAFDKKEAGDMARQHCRFVTSLEPVTAASKIMNADLGELFGGGKKIKSKELSLLCSQLSIELKAGLPLVRSLQLVAEQEENKTLKAILTQVAEDVHAGHGLADSFALRGPQLPNTFIETVRAGEESGRLDDSFARLKKYYQNAANVSGKVGSAMIYPIMLIVVAVVVVAIIMIKAVPVFEDSFSSMGNELPAPTRILIAISHFFTDNILLLLAIVAAAAIALVLFKRSETGRMFFARLALKFPGLGLVNRMSAASEFAATMSTMMASGLPMVQALNITANVLSNALVAEDVRAATRGVLEGRRMSDGLMKSQWLPHLLLEMTGVGEETGSLEETLDVISAYYTEEVDTAVARALGILEPCITIVLALLVVFILLAVYMPLFSMYGSV